MTSSLHRNKKAVSLAAALFLILGAACFGQAGAQEASLRTFRLPLPLFKADSAWNQRADQAAVLPESRTMIQTLYRTLLGDRTGLRPSGYGMENPWPFMFVNYDEYSVPIWRSGSAMSPITLVDYNGLPGGVTDKFTLNADGTINGPVPAGPVRPSGPQDISADGHLILFDPATGLMYDFWQVTNARDSDGVSLGGGRVGSSIYAVGAADYFRADGSGANPVGYHSAAATGVPLIAGLITPEDIESGTIAHALACAVPGLRNTNASDPSEPFSSDYYYPAATTEGEYYNTNPLSLAAGQRLRLKPTLLDDEDRLLDETTLAPITGMFLQALRTYGLYLRDNAAGFTFYAEDIHSAPLNLSLTEVNRLAGRAEGTALEDGKTKWRILMEALNMDLERIPLASGSWEEGQDPARAVMETSNFEVVAPADIPSDYR